jgi:protein Hikeshi
MEVEGFDQPQPQIQPFSAWSSASMPPGPALGFLAPPAPSPLLGSPTPMVASVNGGSSSPLLGLVVPGGLVRTDWVPVDATGTKWSLTLSSPGDLPCPVTVVNELVCFLLPSPLLPSNHGVLLYWQAHVVSSSSGSTASMMHQDTVTGFEVFGSLTPQRPSAILRTGWSEHDQLVSVMGIPPPPCVTVTIGVSIEPLEQIQNIVGSGNSNSASAAATARRPLVAQKIALDLFNFMSSFDTGSSPSSTTMVVPKNIFERWWKRFEAKSQRDPNFFLKPQD